MCICESLDADQIIALWTIEDTHCCRHSAVVHALLRQFLLYSTVQWNSITMSTAFMGKLFFNMLKIASIRWLQRSQNAVSTCLRVHQHPCGQRHTPPLGQGSKDWVHPWPGQPPVIRRFPSHWSISSFQKDLRDMNIKHLYEVVQTQL